MRVNPSCEPFNKKEFDALTSVATARVDGLPFYNPEPASSSLADVSSSSVWWSSKRQGGKRAKTQSVAYGDNRLGTS